MYSVVNENIVQHLQIMNDSIFKNNIKNEEKRIF